MKKLMIISFMFAGLATVNSDATDISSVSGMEGSWADTGSWNGGVVPATNDTAFINWGSAVNVDSVVKVGDLTFDGGGGFVNVTSGGSLKIDDSGSGDGCITHNPRNWPMGISVTDGTLLVNGDYKIQNGWEDAGVKGTNSLSVSGASTVELHYFEVGWYDGFTGGSLVSISGNEATFGVWANLHLGAKSTLNMNIAADGTVSHIDMLWDGSTVTLNGGTLAVDLSAMTVTPDEIILINNTGTDAIAGTFGSINITGSSTYVVSYTGGTGNDLSLVTIPKPASLGLIGMLY